MRAVRSHVAAGLVVRLYERGTVFPAKQAGAVHAGVIANVQRLIEAVEGRRNDVLVLFKQFAAEWATSMAVVKQRHLRDNGSAFNGRPGADQLSTHEERSARSVRSSAGSSRG